jgi:hypothetical protein
MKARTVLAACMILCGLAAALVVPAVVHADAGLRDGAYAAGTSGSPTTSKPESKLWFNDGAWWAVMATPAGNNVDYHIFKLNLRTQRWHDTGVLVDSRASTRQDVLSNGNTLLIASHKYVSTARTTIDPGDMIHLYRFHYDGSTYAQDSDTTIVQPQKTETFVIDRDGSGSVWGTWVQGGQVLVASTQGSCATGVAAPACDWGSPVSIAPASEDDISSIVRVGSDVAVVWSDTRNKDDCHIFFRLHQGGVWGASEDAGGGPKMADDHVNVKVFGGRVFVATKTKFGGQTRPGTMLLVRNGANSWKHYTVTSASLDHTRPIVVIDRSHKRIQVFEGSIHNNAIYMKTSKLNSINFKSGSQGPRVIQDSGSQMANPTSTKQNISNSTRLIVLATNPATKRYWHAYFQIIPCIKGNAGNNTLVGTRGNDALCGLGGNDTLKGLAGKDRLIGSKGRDTFIARDGFRDVLVGGRGHDRARVDRRDVRRSIEAIF